MISILWYFQKIPRTNEEVLFFFASNHNPRLFFVWFFSTISKDIPHHICLLECIQYKHCINITFKRPIPQRIKLPRTSTTLSPLLRVAAAPVAAALVAVQPRRAQRVPPVSLGESWPVFSPAEFILGEHDGVSFFFKSDSKNSRTYGKSLGFT